MLWYPYAQMKTMAPPIEILDARGVYLYTRERPLIDSISSWWAMIHGYKHPELTQAIVEQAERFSHVMLGGLTHEPALRLADKLAEILPGDLDYCFFSDSGSVAVEVALKMALQYYVNREQSGRVSVLALTDGHHGGDLTLQFKEDYRPRRRVGVLALNDAYHGDTFKTMEVGDDEDYHFILNALGRRADVYHIPTTLEALEDAFAQHGDELCCMLVEPLLQGGGGMLMYDLEFLRRAHELCDEHDVLLVFDEIATGFGRTGVRFVAELVQPDIITLGKALTGGYIGHAVTVASKRVFDAFYDDSPERALMHGPTFMANPLACAAALKSIEIFERDDYLAKIKRIESIARRELADLNDPRVKEKRIMGGVACIEVHDPSTLTGYAQFARERGVFSRPFKNIVYTTPPYIIEESELVQILGVMKDFFAVARNASR